MNATFKYISPPLDYVLVEILKNAFRFVICFCISSVFYSAYLYIVPDISKGGYCYIEKFTCAVYPVRLLEMVILCYFN